MSALSKLEQLMIGEVSGVDDPANEIPGWMVAKATAPSLLQEAGRMEAFTKASDSKEPYGNVKYADPGYQEDGKNRYPLDSEEHVRAAWSYISQKDNAALYSADQLAKIKSAIEGAAKKLGVEIAGTTKDSHAADAVEDAPGLLAKLREVLFKASPDDPTTTEEVEVTKEELFAALDERDEALVEKVAEKLAAVEKSVEAPGATEGAEATNGAAAEETVPAVTAEDISKAVADALAPYNELIEKVLDRVERIEETHGIVARKSLEGQETGTEVEGEAKAPAIGDAFGALAKAAREGRHLTMQG